jgi:hypothetical protein
MEICRALHAPPRLIAHLTLVHDVASRLVAAIQNVFPTLEFDADSVIFGAATHDIGKVTCPEELVGPGKSHEEKGADLLRNFGISEQRARFTATHARWNNSGVQIDDLLVALADNCWKGKRVPELEEKIVVTIADATGKAHWEVFAALDNIVHDLAADADTRLAWQAQFPAA